MEGKTVKSRVLKRNEYVVDDVVVLEDEKSEFKEKMTHAEKVNDIFTGIQDELSVIINYGCKLELVKEEFRRKGLLK